MRKIYLLSSILIFLILFLTFVTPYFMANIEIDDSYKSLSSIADPVDTGEIKFVVSTDDSENQLTFVARYEGNEKITQLQDLYVDDTQSPIGSSITADIRVMRVPVQSSQGQRITINLSFNGLFSKTHGYSMILLGKGGKLLQESKSENITDVKVISQ